MREYLHPRDLQMAGEVWTHIGGAKFSGRNYTHYVKSYVGNRCVPGPRNWTQYIEITRHICGNQVEIEHFA